MKIITTKNLIVICIILFSTCWDVAGSVTACFGQTSAMEEMLFLLKKKGTLTGQEADVLRGLFAAERKELKQIQKELAEKERLLDAREKLLENTQVRKEAPPVPESPREILTAASADVPGRKIGKGMPLGAYYDEGFCLGAEDKEDMSLCFNSFLQADYRYFDYEEGDPQKNKFDLRRVRLALSGNLLKRFAYKFEYEFQGAESRRLVDAYLDSILVTPISLRIGQFKQPFGLEQVSDDEVVPFAERSMGYYLTPQRDVGAMFHGDMLGDRISYAVGIFNGDGPDDSTRGNNDTPEITGRIGIAALKMISIPALEGLHLGLSGSYAEIDAANVRIGVKTSGMTTLFDVASAAKFNIIRDAESRSRYSAELGWVWGPLLAYGEYTKMEYKGIATSADKFDAGMSDYYGSVLWMITGERPRISKGRIMPIIPKKALWEGGWGGLGLAVRYDLFEAEESVYDYLIREGNSVRKAKGYSVALNWFLNRYVKFIVDFSRTEFDKPLLIARDPLSGTAVYSDREDVVTARFQMGF